MIALVEGAARQRTPNEIALSLVLSAFTLIFLIVTATCGRWPRTPSYMADYRGAADLSLGTDIPTLVALLVCLIPTTIGALLAAIGIAGMDRALRATSSPRAARRSRWPATSTRCCSTRPARSRWATAGRRVRAAAGRSTAAEARPAGRAVAVAGRRDAGGQEHRRAAPSSTPSGEHAARARRRGRRSSRSPPRRG